MERVAMMLTRMLEYLLFSICLLIHLCTPEESATVYVFHKKFESYVLDVLHGKDHTMPSTP